MSVDGGRSWAEFKGNGFPSVAVRDLQVHARDGDLVIATHGRGIWIVDDLSPLRALSPNVLSQEAALLPGRPLQQRMPSSGGWANGDAAFVGQNPLGDGVITYYQRARHLFGTMGIDVLDSTGKVVDTLTPTEHAGLNRVVWSMRVKPPKVPRAATVAGAGFQGARMVPGEYTVRLTRGALKIQMPVQVVVDARAPYGTAERRENFAAAMRVQALFEDMSALVGALTAAHQGVEGAVRKLGEKDSLAKALDEFSEKLETLRKKIVATKEGGAITGEERIREHADSVYGSLMSWEGRPTPYQLARIDTLKRELSDVKDEYDQLLRKELSPLNERLTKRKLTPIVVPSSATPVASDGAEATLLMSCHDARVVGCSYQAAQKAMPAERD
jgi:hypothetical protein